jgi:hypothetical protein
VLAGSLSAIAATRAAAVAKSFWYRNGALRINGSGNPIYGDDPDGCCCPTPYSQECKNLEELCPDAIDIKISGENTITQLNETWRLYQDDSTHTLWYASWFIFSPYMLIFDMSLECVKCEGVGVRWMLSVNMTWCACGVWNEGGNTILFGPFVLQEERCPNYTTWPSGGATHSFFDDESCRESVRKCWPVGDVSLYNCPGEADICWDISRWTVEIKEV